MLTLETAELSKTYRGRRVVDDVTLRVQEGQVIGLLGPNGAGKTTSFYMIVGLISSDSSRSARSVNSALSSSAAFWLRGPV